MELKSYRCEERSDEAIQENVQISTRDRFAALAIMVLGLVHWLPRSASQLKYTPDLSFASFASFADKLFGLSPPCPSQHRMQQHIAAGFDPFGFGVLDFVVADAAYAGHEDH
jgi:hypothetical protein